MSTTQNEVLFTEGEPLVLDDLRDMQRFLKSQVFDQYIGAGVRSEVGDSGLPSSEMAGFALVPHAGSAYPRPGATTRRITNAAGMIYQWISTSTPDGEECNLLGYQLAADELQFDLAANGSGSARIDGVFVKLSYDDNQDSQTRDFRDGTTLAVSTDSYYKKRRTVLSAQVVAGTPAATPAYPSTPAGYVPYCYVWVLSGASGTFASNYILDNRMPMRVGVLRTFATEARTNNGWALNSGRYHFQSGAGEGQFQFPGGPECRILRVNIHAVVANGTDLTAVMSSGQLGDYSGGHPGPWPQVSFNVPAYNGGFVSRATTKTVYGRDAGDRMPWWGSGTNGGVYVFHEDPSNSLSSASITFDNTHGSYTDKIGCVEWVFAY